MDTAGEFTHFDEKGNAWMVDVSEKDVTRRCAAAEGTIRMSRKAYEAVEGKRIRKGDVLTVAQVAGIMGAKRTSELIPLCHILLLEKVAVRFEMLPELPGVRVECQVRNSGKTGVEMEALTGTSVALLTIYDMCKAIDKRMVLENIHLVEKSGGKSGEFRF